MGLWSSFARKILKQIASKTIVFNNLSTAEALKYLIQRISTTLWSFNCQNADAEADHLDCLNLFFVLFCFVLFCFVLALPLLLLKKIIHVAKFSTRKNSRKVVNKASDTS